MKKNMILVLLLLSVISANLFAQAETSTEEKKFSIILGPEWNMNSRENFAAGAVVGFQYDFLHVFAAGIHFTASTNFNGIAVLEPMAMFRWYFLTVPGTYAGFFAEADAGAYLVLEDGDMTPLFNGGLKGGFRLPLGDTFFIEPYGRIGYPFAFGIGVAAGVKF
jgi:hypothetical protein